MACPGGRSSGKAIAIVVGVGGRGAWDIGALYIESCLLVSHHCKA